MGMDGVEIVLAIEEQFGISIPDSEAEKVRTPGMLIDLVMTKVTNAGRDVCRSQRGFNLTRRFLMEQFGIAREAVTLNVPIRQFVAREQERDFWLGLRESLRARRWPALQFSKRFLEAVTCIGLLAMGPATYWSWMWFGAAGFLAGPLLGILFSYAITLLFAKRRRFLPKDIETVRDVSMAIAAVVEEGKWHRAEVAHVVHKIVEDVLALPPGVYREDADFIKALGLE